MRLLIQFSSPDILEALRNTDLSSTDQTLSLASVLNRSNPGKVECTALSESAAKGLSTATDQEHVSALAEVLRRLRTENGLDALLAYNGPDNQQVNRARSEVTQYVDAENKRLEEDLKLARELLDGTKTPDDLVETHAFVWKDGQYELAE